MKEQGLKTLNDLLLQSTEKYPEGIALARDNDYLTYKQLNTSAQSVAGFLQNQGIKPGDPVAILSENSPQWGVIFFGIIKAGGTIVILDILNSEEELLYVLNHSETKVCFASETQIHKLHTIKDRFAAIVHIHQTSVIENFSSSNHQHVEIDGSSTAILIYTSGTMGNQKGVMLSHTNIISNIIGGFTYFSINPATSFLSLIPLSHMFGISVGFLAPLYNGATVTYSKSLKGEEILKALNQSKTEILVLVPLILKKFYQSITSKVNQYSPVRRFAFNAIFRLAANSEKLGISIGKWLFRKIHKSMGGHLNYFISGGAPLEPKIEKFFNTVGIPILNGYGLTETSPIVSVNSLRNRKFGSAGKVIPNIELKISPEGEIQIHGPTVMKGYFKDTEATQTVIENNWFKSGDIGEVDKDGYLFIKDRIKNVIVLPSGLKIFPNEIELEIGPSPLFKETCVVKRATPDGEEPIVVVYPDQNLLKGLSLEEKRSKIRQELENYQKKLPPYKKVLDFEIWNEELPKTSTKKVKRKTLETQVNSKSKENNAKVSDNFLLNDQEAHIAFLLGKFLNVSNTEIDHQTNLRNDLGIDSIMKIELISDIEKDLNISIPEEIIYTIESFADLIQTINNYSEKTKTEETQAKQEEITKEPGKITKAICSFLIFGFLKLLFKIELVNGDRIPQTGAFIIVANHSSMLDFPVLSAILPGKVRKVISVPAAYDYFYKKSLGTWFFRAGFNMFPMKRYGNYYDGLKICANKIKEGKPLIVFPEGTRSVSGNLQKFKPGVGLLAFDLNVPLIPMYIKGAYKALHKGSIIPKPGKIQVIVGEAIHALKFKNTINNEPNYVLYQKITEEVRNTIELLIAEN